MPIATPIGRPTGTPIGRPIATPIGRPTASERTRTEGDQWTQLSLLTATEYGVMGTYDPGSDLDRRAAEWGHRLASHDLGAIALFAAALAHTEADAWDDGTLDVATRAYEARRFLLGDRIVHWAVPWLLATGSGDDAVFLLDLGDEMRVAPELSGREGLVVKGEDSLGPLSQDGGIWSGWIEQSEPPADLPGYWTDLARRHPGTAQLWLDLAARAG